MKVILVISNEPWGKQWFSKHHYANELASLGIVVYFVDPPSKWNWRNLIKRKIEISEIKPNLYKLTYNNLLPARLFRSLVIRINDWLNSKRISKAISYDEVIIWQFDVFRFVRNFFRNSKRIFHVVDPYLLFDSDRILAANSDLVVCTSRFNIGHYEALNRNVIHIPHGVPKEIQVDENEARSIMETYGRFFLLIGSVNSRVDLNLLKLVAEKSNVKILVIGPNLLKGKSKSRFEEICAHKNVEYLGVMEHGQLKNYVQNALAGLVLYRKRTEGDGDGSPLKVLNYISQFVPVISSIDADIPALENEIIYSDLEHSELLSLLARAENGSLHANRKKTERYLDAIRYDRLINKIISTLE